MIDHPGFTFCVCPDVTLSHRYAANLTEKYSFGGTNASWETRTFWGDEPLTSAFWESMEANGLFNRPRQIIVRNAQTLPADVWKKISSLLARVASDIWPFLFLEVPFEKGQPKIPVHIRKLKCWDFGHNKKWVWLCPGIDSGTIKKYISQIATDLHLTFDPYALDTLCSKLPYNAAAIDNEMQKLSLVAPDKRITKELAQWAGQETQLDIFTFIRSIQENKNQHKIWSTVLADQLSGETSFFGSTAMLLREARILWQLFYNEPVQLPPSIITIKERLAKKLGITRIAALWEAVYLAERGVKTGEHSPQQAMESLVAELALLFSASH